MDQFETHVDLGTIAHATTIALFRERHESDRGGVPKPTDPTGTVTFIRYRDKTYAVTARHVIEALDKLAAKEGINPFYLCPVAPGITIHGPFFYPTKFFGESEPDIAICPIHNALPAYIGKSAYQISEADDPKWEELTHGIAHGYPTALKYDHSRNGRTLLSLPGATAVAASLRSNAQYLPFASFQSELDTPLTISSLSGMSGGPVFWCKKEIYGLLGFVIENLGIASGGDEEAVLGSDMQQNEGELISDAQMVNFTIQQAWHERLVEWLIETDHKHPRERIKRHERLQSKQTSSERTLEEFLRADRESTRQGVVFEEWREKLRVGQRLPRGRFFRGRYPGPERAHCLGARNHAIAPSPKD